MNNLDIDYFFKIKKMLFSPVPEDDSIKVQTKKYTKRAKKNNDLSNNTTLENVGNSIEKTELQTPLVVKQEDFNIDYCTSIFDEVLFPKEIVQTSNIKKRGRPAEKSDSSHLVSDNSKKIKKNILDNLYESPQKVIPTAVNLRSRDLIFPQPENEIPPKKKRTPIKVNNTVADYVNNTQLSDISSTNAVNDTNNDTNNNTTTINLNFNFFINNHKANENSQQITVENNKFLKLMEFITKEFQIKP